MKQFKDFGIVLANKVLTGDKVKMAKILNREIKVLNFKIDESKYPKNKSGKCLQLQIEHENEKYVIFTGSDILIDQILQVSESDFPFETIIIKEGEHFEFS